MAVAGLWQHWTKSQPKECFLAIFLISLAFCMRKKRQHFLSIPETLHNVILVIINNYCIIAGAHGFSKNSQQEETRDMDRMDDG